jgi:hypothetical protein
MACFVYFKCAKKALNLKYFLLLFFTRLINIQIKQMTINLSHAQKWSSSASAINNRILFEWENATFSRLFNVFFDEK